MEPDSISSGYRGRFAPSPTGPLHFGSLVAALASYLQALANQGEWLLRIEDLDPPREAPGAAEHIVRTLETHGFQWNGPVRHQSTQLAEYHAVVESLLTAGAAYRCTCTREEVQRAAATIGSAGPVYPGTCRNLGRIASPQAPDALRLRTDHSTISFEDVLHGQISCNVTESIGDFIIRRKDGLISYHLAVVIDDARQGMTEIVRGYDLLDVTPAHVKLQQVLHLPTPIYMHVPVVFNDRGQKLSKQTGAKPINETKPGENLFAALEFLRQDPPGELADEDTDTIWGWAADHWYPEKLAAKRQPEEKNYQ